MSLSLSDLSQLEKRLGSFSSDPSTYIKGFKYLPQSYDLTWNYIYSILSSTLSPEEKERVWLATQAHLHWQGKHQLVGAAAVPRQDPNWDSQVDSPATDTSHMATCLTAGLRKAAYRAVSYEKLKEKCQGPDENPALFLD